MYTDIFIVFFPHLSKVTGAYVKRSLFHCRNLRWNHFYLNSIPFHLHQMSSRIENDDDNRKWILVNSMKIWVKVEIIHPFQERKGNKMPHIFLCKLILSSVSIQIFHLSCPPFNKYYKYAQELQYFRKQKVWFFSERQIHCAYRIQQTLSF